MEQVSTSVVISGAAMIAGSKLIFFANSGRIQPMIFDKMTVQIRERPITTASFKSLYMIKIHSPFASASPRLTSSATRNSLNMTLKISLKRISSNASPRMIKVEL